MMTTDSGGKPHLDVDVWLQNLDLAQYSHLFSKYQGVQDILWMSEKDVKELGVRNGAHRATMASSLVILRRKYEKGKSVKTGRALLSSKVRSSESLISQPKTPLLGKTQSYPSILDHSVEKLSPSSSGRSSITPSHRSSMDPPVTMETSPEDLKRALEWELGLDSTDLRSHAWYHGTIPRQRAEELMTAEGVFLIRDCISRPGDFVLTCCWKGSPLHFVINKVVLQPFTVYERIQYQFEDDCFDTVPDLVTFYVGNKRPISVASGAVVTRPVNRSMPLSYYATRYGVECQVQYPSNGQSSSSGQQPQTPCGTLRATHSHKKAFVRVGSDPMLSPTLERRPWEHRPLSGTLSAEVSEKIRLDTGQSEDKPPPKPSRVPSRRSQQKPNIPQRSIPQYVNNGEGHVYSELVESITKPQTEDVLGATRVAKNLQRENQRMRLVVTVSAENPDTSDRTITLPDLDPPSTYDLSAFSTRLLPCDNKPLDKSVVGHLRGIILECGPRVLANHLTRVDLDLLHVSKTKDLGLGVLSGLELLLLPQGSRLRKDLLERTECLKFLVAVTILTCSSEDERVELLNKWIQVAMDTKTAVGNLHGFTGIMQGLSITQISRLKATWLTLRQKYTATALAYETKLRPTLRSMQECSNPQAPNTCLPYLLSLITILEINYDMECTKAPSKDVNVELPWERTASDYGLQLLLQHLENGSAIIRQYATLKRNSEIVFENVKLDDTLLEVFRTEFQLLFLWGAKGATVAQSERHSKLEQVLTAMSYRCEATIS
ncbi:SH2 domain-containing protein 3C-like isoform X2 [Ornithodoros turicata]